MAGPILRTWDIPDGDLPSFTPRLFAELQMVVVPGVATLHNDDLMSGNLLLAAFQEALRHVDPEEVLPAALPAFPKGRTVVVGAGKAAAAMAGVVEKNWPAELSGLVVVPYGHALPCERIRIVEAAHPVPDSQGLAAAKEMMTVVSGLSEDDLVIALFSGGGSALLPLPAGAIAFEDKQSLITQLLRVGATISEINCVRKHLSAIKGGRLACACAPATVVCLLVSDVAGDDPSAIASGPTVPDPSTLADARHVIDKYKLRISAGVLTHLSSPENETPKPGDLCFARVANSIIASSQQLLESAVRLLREHGVNPVILSNAMEGESADVALVHAAIARQIARYSQPFAAPCVLLSGGETTVTIRGSGRGGPNSEFLLAMALALGEEINYAAIACDTDGIDGMGPMAGAMARTDTLRRAEAAGLNAREMLRANDSHSFFDALGDGVVTGPTLTNVNDFRAVLVLPAEPEADCYLSARSCGL